MGNHHKIKNTLTARSNHEFPITTNIKKSDLTKENQTQTPMHLKKKEQEVMKCMWFYGGCVFRWLVQRQTNATMNWCGG